MSLIVIPPPTRAITVNSTGAGNRNTAGGSPLSTNFTHVVTEGSNRRMYAFVAVSHNNWLTGYTALTASSSINGAFTLIAGPVLFGDVIGTYRQGAVAIFELVNPSVGSHTITLSVSASQALNMVGGNTRCYNNVGGWGTPVTQAQTASDGALNISVSSTVGDMALLVSALNGSPTFSGGSPTPWYSVDDGGISGDAKYLRGLDRAGTGGSFAFTTSSSHKLGAIGINLTKA